MEYNAGTGIVRVRFKNLMLTSLPLYLLYSLYATNPGIKVLKISGPLLLNPIDLSIECNAKTAVIRVTIIDLMLTLFLVDLLY